MFNPYPAEFLGTVHNQFLGNQNVHLKLASQKYKAWSDCTDVQAGIAL